MNESAALTRFGRLKRPPFVRPPATPVRLRKQVRDRFVNERVGDPAMPEGIATVVNMKKRDRQR